MFQVYLNTFLITLFFSFCVQSLFYLWYRLTNNRILKYQHVFGYYSGIIGDGLLVPLVNVFAIKTLYDNGLSFNASYAGLGLIGGFLTTFVFHFGQKYFNQINWTMPKKGEWNLLGLYHSIFMFFESSFLCYILFIFLDRISSYWEVVYSPVGAGLGVLFVFFLTFIYDYWKTLFRKLFVD